MSCQDFHCDSKILVPPDYISQTHNCTVKGSDKASNQCCVVYAHSVIKKNPRIYHEKKQENNKNPRHTKCCKKSKPNLKCKLAVLAHKN